MTAAYFEDHPTDPEKVILRKKPRVEDDDDIQDYKKAWVELTDKEIRALAKPSDDIEIPMTGRMWIFVGDLMNKLKEKNT
jgi:hypothetical protein